MQINHSFDPCERISKIDFNNPIHLRKVLARDKHTRIEGICTEAIFVDDLIKESFSKYSTGWWFPRRKTGYHVVKIFSAIDSITELDKEILAFFCTKEVPTYIVSFNDFEKAFYYLRIDDKVLDSFNNQWDKKKKEYPRTNSPPPLPASAYRSQERLEKAFDILESLNLLKKSAIERVLANCFINAKGLWDIDTFSMVDNQLIAFEVKQKYPTKKGTFGLNTGLAKLFHFLNDISVRVIHIILTKPSSIKSIPATDYYTQDKYKGKSMWIGTDFSGEILSSSISSAPTETSIFSNQHLNYYHIYPESFTRLKLLKENQKNTLMKYLNGSLNKLSNVDEIPQMTN